MNLIEQLGEDFTQLIRYGDHFAASGDGLGSVHGKTPDEALARLLVLKHYKTHTQGTESPPSASQVPSPFEM